MKTLSIKLSNSYFRYIRHLIKNKQHLKNILIFNYNNSKDGSFLDYEIIRAIVFETSGGKKSEEVNKFRATYKSIVTELVKFSHLKNKIVEEIVKEIKSNYKACWTLLKDGLQTSFNMRPKKLSRVFHGSVMIPNEAILKPSKNCLNFSIYSTKHKRGNKLQIHIGKELSEKFKTCEIKVCKLTFNNTECSLNITYEENNSLSQIEGEHLVGIDPGMNNHFTVVTTNNNFSSLLLRNSAINRINEKLNVESKNDLRRKDYFKLRYRNIKRTKIVNNELHKIAKRLIDYCFLTRSSKIVIGYNKNQKEGINIGRKNNRYYHSTPHQKLYEYLEYLCPLHGIEVIKQEESYTSKLSCQYDEVWKYEYMKLKPTESSGLRGFKRITSLFKDKNNKIIHADVNGAFNIIWKCLQKKLHIENHQLCNPILVKNDYKFLSELNKGR